MSRRGPRLPPEDAARLRHLEWLQRRAWAKELGLDPGEVDLQRLPPVPADRPRPA